MQLSRTRSEVLYVTADPGNRRDVVERFAFDGVDLSLAGIADGPDELDLGTVDCLVLCNSLDTTQALACVRVVRAEHDALPIVAFTGDRASSFATDLLDAGVTELVRGRATEVAPAVVRTRLETVLAADREGAQDRQRARLEQFEEQAELFRHVSENISDVVWVNDPDEEGLAFVNEAFETVWGRPRDPLYESREVLVEAVHPDDRERVREAMDRQLDHPESYDVRFRVVRPDGEQRWVHGRAFGVRENGELERIVGVATDITGRKSREHELASERDLVERIFETTPVGLVVIDATGTIERANEQAAAILGVPRDDLEGGPYAPEGLDVRTMDGQQLDTGAFPFTQISTTGEPLRDEQLVVEPRDGDESVLSVDGVPLFGDGTLERVVIAFDDVTDRVERERRLTEQRDELAQVDHINRIIRGVDEALLGATSRAEILQAVCDNIADTDRYQFAIALERVGDDRLESPTWTDEATPLVEEIFPVSDVSPEQSPGLQAIETGETVVVDHVGSHPTVERWAETFAEAGVGSLVAIPLQYDDQRYGAIAVYATREDVFTERELDVLAELGGTVGYAIAAVESREREQMLTSLYEATQDLLAAETEESISDVVVDTASSVLELPAIGIFLFDDDENVLEPVAATETLFDFYGEWTHFGPGREDSITWQTYVTGERQLFTDVRESDHLANRETPARSALFVPLGDHGVFVASSAESDAFDDQKRQLVGLLAATTEAALDRVAGREGIRKRDQRLEEHARRLEQVRRTLTLLRDLNRHLRRVATRSEFERGVCDLLVEQDEVDFAWIGRVPPDPNAVEPQSWAGTEDGYLDAVSLGLDGDEPAARAARQGTVINVSNLTDHLREGDWAREGVNRDFESALAVPLEYAGTSYGVLALYATGQGTFDEVVQRVAGDIGEMLAHAINTIETRRGILSDQQIELELALGEDGRFLNAVADVTDQPVSYRELAHEAEDRTRLLFEVDHAPVSAVVALESEFVAVESLTHVERPDVDLFRATLSGRSVAAMLLECGAVPREVTATREDTLATVWLPGELDVRVFLERVREHYPETELVSRRNVEGSAEARESARVALEEELTDRQREVLVTAYESGFFQSPRETTGEELAALLDLAQPTVTHHLREAQRRLLAALLDDA